MKYLILAILALSFNFNQLAGNVDTKFLESTISKEIEVITTIVDIYMDIWYDPDGAEHILRFYMDDGSFWENVYEKDFINDWHVGDKIKIIKDGWYYIGYNLNNDTCIYLY